MIGDRSHLDTRLRVYLMRGLPSSGKSTTARKLAGPPSAGGVVCETDEYFYTQVGSDPTRFDYRADLMDTARSWNFQRFCEAVDAQRSPVVVDRGNALSLETQRYARYAVEAGYRVELAEPDSAHWAEIRVLLRYRHLTEPALDEWADRLAAMNKRTHRVPAETIRNWMGKWKSDLTVDQILTYAPRPRSPRIVAGD